MLEPYEGKLSSPVLRRGRASNRSFLFDNEEMYEDETGYKKGEIQKRKIVETEMFSVDERIKIMSKIYVIARNDEKKST